MLGKKLKKLIRSLKLKQIDLANHLGISPSRLSNYLSDKREPDFAMLIEMVKFLGTDLNSLAGVEFSKIPECKTKKYATPVVAEYDDSYNVTGDKETIRVAFLPINAKKRGINSNTIPVCSEFLSNVYDPEKNVSVFHINGSIPYSITEENDYVICAKCFATTLSNGDLVLENGRNSRFFKYYGDGNDAMLINTDDDKEHLRINVQDVADNYYKVLWIMKKH